jgi:hypothetical protein
MTFTDYTGFDQKWTKKHRERQTNKQL